jgi:hypothetical protein
MTTEGPISDGELAARISNTVVRALSRTTGRGPTKAKTTLGANGVFVAVELFVLEPVPSANAP